MVEPLTVNALQRIQQWVDDVAQMFFVKNSPAIEFGLQTATTYVVHH